MSAETMIKLRIPGKKIEVDKGLGWQQDSLTVNNVRTYILEATRGEVEERPVERAKPDEVVEVELENGMRFWHAPNRLRDEVFAELGIKRGAEDEIFDIPMSLRRRKRRTGNGGVVIKVLRFFGVDIPELGATKIALKIENSALKTGRERNCTAAAIRGFLN